MKAHINIGSNLGDSLALIHRSIKAIEGLEGHQAAVSTPVESEPWGYESTNIYTNVGIMIDTSLPAERLLAELKNIERSISPASHRNADGSYRDRLIDIDLIDLEGYRVDTPELTLPHPRMHLREFVLRPLAELAPEWRHPILDATAAELLERL